jgi:hypothetical protein
VDRTGMGHTVVVGRLVLGHTARWRVGGWGRQVIIRTSPGGESAGIGTYALPVKVLPVLVDDSGWGGVRWSRYC